MKINDAAKYSLKNIKNRKFKTVITIIVLTFLNFIMLFSITLGINTKSSVESNYLKSFQKNGYEIIVNGIPEDTSSYQYTQIQEQMDKNRENISVVYSYCSDILFYDLTYSNITLPYQLNTNGIILTEEYQENFKVGDEFEVVLRGYNNISNAVFNVVGFSSDIESPIADLNYLVFNIAMDKFYIKFTPNRTLSLNDLNKSYDLYNFINKMGKHSYVNCVFLDNYGPNIKKATFFEMASILIAIILMISTISSILNILISNFNSDKELYANLLILGESKKSIAQIAIFDVVLNVFISTIFASSIELLMLKPTKKILKIFVEYIFTEDITYLGNDKVFINLNPHIYIPFILFLFNCIIILLCLFIKFKSLYKKSPAIVMKEVSE